jgi:hypothetical protein
MHEAAAFAVHASDRASSPVLESPPQIGSFHSLDQFFEPLMGRPLVGIQHARIDQTSFFGQKPFCKSPHEDR